MKNKIALYISTFLLIFQIFFTTGCNKSHREEVLPGTTEGITQQGLSTNEKVCCWGSCIAGTLCCIAVPVACIGVGKC